MATIKPIETIYNGYRFRSRLEARWAVFFDAAGITYEYEPEGYELKDGTYYLPDFFLPKFNVYVEIKPLQESKIESWKKKCERFRDSTGKSIIIMFGDPVDYSYENTFYGFWKKNEYSSKTFVHESHAEFAEMYDHCKKTWNIILYVEDFSWGKDEIVLTEESEEINKYVCCEGMIAKYWWDMVCKQIHDNIVNYKLLSNEKESVLDNARLKARKSRFEHGECG